MTTPNKKALMAEMLVRQVFGDSAEFEMLCSERGIPLEDAVEQALCGWAKSPLPTTRREHRLLSLISKTSPDPADCPEGQEGHWIEVCQHDIDVLRREQRQCFLQKDGVALERTNRAIETYIQTLAHLKERVA